MVLLTLQRSSYKHKELGNRRLETTFVRVVWGMHVSGSRTRPSPVHFKLRVEVLGLSAVGVKAVVGVEFQFYLSLSVALLCGYAA